MTRPRFALLFLTLAVPLFNDAHAAAPQIRLTEKEASDIGHKVWRNECGGTIQGLTSWNSGENFASLGIGHFIWYPKGVTGPFEESFPKLVAFFQASGVKLPGWLKPETQCPWSSRANFQAAANSSQMKELRGLLSSTLQLQTEFLIQRLENALPKMLAATAPAKRDLVSARFYRVLHSGGAGAFALIDYVNFKGEGVLKTERYKDEGWGLLQALETMTDKGAPVRDFSNAAKAVLERRVHNAPRERHEEKWLPGWKSRVGAYAE